MQCVQSCFFDQTTALERVTIKGIATAENCQTDVKFLQQQDVSFQSAGQRADPQLLSALVGMPKVLHSTVYIARNQKSVSQTTNEDTCVWQPPRQHKNNNNKRCTCACND
jgi:hypothetical protein